MLCTFFLYLFIEVVDIDGVIGRDIHHVHVSRKTRQALFFYVYFYYSENKLKTIIECSI